MARSNTFLFRIVVLAAIWKCVVEGDVTLNVCWNCGIDSICHDIEQGLTLAQCVDKLNGTHQGFPVQAVSYRSEGAVKDCNIYICYASFEPFERTTYGMIAFRWSYNTVCSNFTVNNYEANTGVAGAVPFETVSVNNKNECQELCYERDTSCAVDYTNSPMECKLYTHCGDCPTEQSEADETFSKECHGNTEGTNLTTSTPFVTTTSKADDNCTEEFESHENTTGTYTENTETAPRQNPPRIYIVPCHCSVSRTFINLTTEEIEARLILATRINARTTTKALDKLRSKYDDRFSANAIGTVGILVIVVAWCLLLACDVGLFLRNK